MWNAFYNSKVLKGSSTMCGIKNSNPYEGMNWKKMR